MRLEGSGWHMRLEGSGWHMRLEGSGWHMRLEGSGWHMWLEGSGWHMHTHAAAKRALLSPARAVSKVPASSPNFWQVVAQELNLVYSAGECQQIYQSLAPSLTATTAGRKTKKNGQLCCVMVRYDM